MVSASTSLGTFYSNLTSFSNSFFSLLGSSDPVVSKLANLTHSATDQAISNQQSSLSYQASGLPSRRKSFSLLDFFLQSFRLMRVTFIAKSQSLLFSYLLLVIYFLLMVSLFSSSMTTASSCFSKSADTVNASNAATCQANIQEDILIRENVNFLTYVLMYTGMIITGTSAMLFSSYVKVFRNEHRNCKLEKNRREREKDRESVCVFWNSSFGSIFQ